MWVSTAYVIKEQSEDFTIAVVCFRLQPDDIQNAVVNFSSDVMNKQFLLNTEYRVGSMEYVSLLFPDNKEDVAQGLVSEGLLLVEKRREKRLAKLLEGYRKAQDKAKSARVSESSCEILCGGKCFIIIFLPFYSWTCGSMVTSLRMMLRSLATKAELKDGLIMNCSRIS